MQIIPFSEANLALALSNKYTPQSVIESKHHFKYFYKYLSTGLTAKTIVIEPEYISKDFLHDYASYYALCFEQYPKVCQRIHFFDIQFSEAEFTDAILGNEDDNKDFWQHYLGFMVVKPIPVTVIGYTVLKTYEDGKDFSLRNFWGVRKYRVHLFGNKITFKSLAFQEQDSVLAACATTAIWSMLNKASVDFHTILKSPSQITKDADNVSPGGNRLFPNKGLNLLQICQAIINSGLVSEIKEPDLALRDAGGQIMENCISSTYIKKILNAYSPIGIPIILVINVPNGGEYGLHAITASGFKLNAPTHHPPAPSICWLADNIEKFYAHDDQWGPFVRVEFLNQSDLETPWTTVHPTRLPTRVVNIVVPIYPKIRISYEDIEVIVLGLDAILTLFFGKSILSDLVWDIKIDFSEKYKSQIKASELDASEKLSLVSRSLPKYLWIACCYIGDVKILEFTFDATDVSNGMIGEDIICYLPADIKAILVGYLQNNVVILQPLLKHKASVNYYDFLLTKLS